MISFGNARCARAVALAVAIAALAGCGEPPSSFTSKQDKFRVGFPSEPRVIDQPTGGIPSRLYTVDGADGAFTVRVIEIPLAADAVAAASDKLLDEAKADLLRSVSGTQTGGESISLAGMYPGRALVATTTSPKPGLLRGRIYLAGTRLYKVTVFGTADYTKTDAATAFLESFMVL